MQGCSAHVNGNVASMDYRFATGYGPANVDGTVFFHFTGSGCTYTGAALDFSTTGIKADILQGSSGTTGNFYASLTDNLADAFTIKEGSNVYLRVKTTNSAGCVSFGNGTTNPTFDFTGTGGMTAGGYVLQSTTYAGLADADATLSDAQHKGQIISVAAGANNRTITTRTAAQLVAAIPNVAVGHTLPLYMSNLKAANTVTIAVGAGVTAPVGTNLVVAAQAAATFMLRFDNIGSGTEAVSLFRVAG